MEIVAVIPARLASTRFPGKVLSRINGRTLLSYVYERVKSASRIEEVYIASGDDEIIEEAQLLKARYIRTQEKHSSGTSRISEVARQLESEIIINVQADEPLISPELLDELATVIAENKDIQILTPVKIIETSYEKKDPNVVKVVFDRNFNALYFSRSPIPYGGSDYYKHIGIYCFRKDILLRYPDMLECELEREEKLEQLRFLWNGYKIRVFITDYESIGVDTPEDLEKVESLLAGKNLR